jgi:curved DNA-binding protein CbpA
VISGPVQEQKLTKPRKTQSGKRSGCRNPKPPKERKKSEDDTQKTENPVRKQKVRIAKREQHQKISRKPQCTANFQFPFVKSQEKPKLTNQGNNWKILYPATPQKCKEPVALAPHDSDSLPNEIIKRPI